MRPKHILQIGAMLALMAFIFSVVSDSPLVAIVGALTFWVFLVLAVYKEYDY